MVETICALMDELAPNAQDRAARKSLITFVADRPGHDLRYAIDASQDRHRSRLGAARDLRSPACARRSNGISPTAAGGNASAAASIAASGWGWLRDPGVRRQWPARPGARRAQAPRVRCRLWRSRTRKPISPTRPPCAPRISRHKPSLVVNAAAYTKVDRRGERNRGGAARQRGRPGRARRGVRSGRRAADPYLDRLCVRRQQRPTPMSRTIRSRPINAYGRSKAAGERAVRETAPQHVILRTSWVYGEFGQNFLKTMLRLAATRDELRVVADQHGCPTSTPDLADAILRSRRVLMAGDNVWGTYHYAGSGVTTWHGFASRIVAAQAPLTGRAPARDPDHRPRNFRRRRAGPPIPFSTAACSCACSALAGGRGPKRPIAITRAAGQRSRKDAACRVRGSFWPAARARGCIR